MKKFLVTEKDMRNIISILIENVNHFGSDDFKSLIEQRDWRLMGMCIDFDKFVSGKNEKYISDFNKYHAVDRSTFDAKIGAIEAYCNNKNIDVSPIKNRIILKCFNVANDNGNKIDESQSQTVVSSNNDVFENLVLGHFQKCYRSSKVL